jgi:hypothetical protein
MMPDPLQPVAAACLEVRAFRPFSEEADPANATLDLTRLGPTLASRESGPS